MLSLSGQGDSSRDGCKKRTARGRRPSLGDDRCRRSFFAPGLGECFTVREGGIKGAGGYGDSLSRRPRSPSDSIVAWWEDYEREGTKDGTLMVRPLRP